MPAQGVQVEDVAVELLRNVANIPIIHKTAGLIHLQGVRAYQHKIDAEFGNPGVNGKAWTNVDFDDSSLEHANCAGWTSPSSFVSGIIGSTTSNGLQWSRDSTGGISDTCNEEHHLYCFMQGP